jgi:hypothetical protein
MGFGGSMTPPPPRAPRRGHFGYRRTYGSCGGGCLSSIVAFFIFVVFIIVAAGSCSSSNYNDSYLSDKAPVSTISREKLTASGSFDSNCIVDELDWFENTKSSGKALKTFYDKTGVQPYVVLLSYDSSLTSDDAKEEYANDYYYKNIDNEDSFLFVYFAEQDQDNEVGYMCYVCGNNARTVMDSEAVDIFWDYIDSYWYSDMSTDELFETVFTKTANSIMGTASSDSSSRLGKTFRNILIIAIVIIAAVIIAKRINKKSDTKDADAAKDNPNILN